MHKMKHLSLVVMLCMILSSIVIISENSKAESTDDTIYVDYSVVYEELSDGSLKYPYKYIQPAIDAASSGDIIQVLPGEYSESLIINKSVTIRSDFMNETIVSSSVKKDYMIYIEADSVSIENMTFDDLTTTSHRDAIFHVTSDNFRLINSFINYSYNGYGLFIDEAYNTLIKNCTINQTKGIKIEGARSTTIYGNVIGNNSNSKLIEIISSNITHIEDNLLLNASYAIHANNVKDSFVSNNTIVTISNTGAYFSDCQNITINNNLIHNNIYNGIDVVSTTCSVYENEIINNSYGLRLNTDNCLVKDNYFNNSRTYGIYCNVGSSKNHIFNNNFSGNPSKVHAKEYGNNYWNNSDGLGNYWDDFYGPDPTCPNNTLSIGDAAFTYSIGGVSDHHPTGVYQTTPIISEPSPTDLSSGIGRSPSLGITATDPDGNDIKVYFYYYDQDNVARQINSQPMTINSGGTATVAINPTYSYIGLGYDYICRWWVKIEDDYSFAYSNATLGREYLFTTVRTPGYNEQPTADAGGPYADVQYDELVGTTVKFDGSASNDTDGEIEFYHWSFGDNETAVNIQSPLHTYKSPGKYEVTLVVIDNHGASHNDTVYVNIIQDINDAPLAHANAVETAVVNEVITFSSAGTTDPDAADRAYLTYQWDMGDGTIYTDETITHQYSSAGAKTVILTVTDPQGEIGVDIIEITIQEPKSDDSPGFELILVIFSMLIFFYIARKKQK